MEYQKMSLIEEIIIEKEIPGWAKIFMPLIFCVL
jgi:hypothetical protein